jgi:short-subunit dehydrogenase
LEQHKQLPIIANQVLEQFGKIDVLVNNGGISQRSFAMDTILEVDRRLMAINYLGTVALTKAVLPSMVAQGGGQIVSVTSLTGMFGTPYRSSYAASKHALHGFFDSLRAELVDKNILVTLIAPGFVRTNISFNAFVGDGSAQNDMDSRQEAGMLPVPFAKKMVRAMEKEKKVAYIGQKEVIMVYIKRFLPSLYYRMIAKVNVK